MSKILLVFGATGQQGGSVIAQVLQDNELSTKYSIRGLTRNVNSAAALKLTKLGVEMVEADQDDPASLTKAYSGVHTVFAVTSTIYDERTRQREIDQGRALADAAVAAGVSLYIYSTLPHVERITGGAIKKTDHFDSKAEVEDYIRTLPLKSVFFAPGSFMSNYHESLKPFPVGDGSYAMASFVKPTTRLPLIDTAGDSGKWVAAALADEDKYVGRVFCAATRLYTLTEIAEILSKSTGKKVVYNQVPEDVWRGFLPPAMVDNIADMFRYFETWGYYGEDTEKLVSWSASQARGKLTTFEEYLEKNPVNLA